MFFFRRKKQPVAAEIDDKAIMVEPEETLLVAALRQGIDFPHSCRIGACAACKCKLTGGRVKALTDASYVLSDDEIAKGMILACQSLPLTDVRIEVGGAGRLLSRGLVTGQIRLTHDITELRVRLEAPLPYKAGQFADISIASLPGVRRSYSFATASRPDRLVSFFVRQAPGGVFSSHINGADVLGQTIELDGPKGDFWLRPAEAPLLFVAGGSGLAPILAMLEEAAGARVERPAVLLFGARGQRDLYAMDVIAQIAGRWQGRFHFVPVLSKEADGTSWAGERGLVNAKIERLIEPGAHVYLCGPPPMIGSALNGLAELGVPRERIFSDSFATLHDAPAPAPA
jgi:NAD(P)H-flavin reductase/ferredoxin